jgi:hypothetical protein
MFLLQLQEEKMRYKEQEMTNEIKNSLLKIVQEFKIHHISNNDYIIDIDYEKHTEEILNLFYYFFQVYTDNK